MGITVNMGLTTWDLPNDFYSHTQLAGNFNALDAHRHVPGEGQRIPTGGIADLAITTAKIGPDAVTPDKIPNASITQQELAKPSVGNPELFDNAVSGTKIADGTISASKVDSTISSIGDVKMWYRVNASISPPVGWEICDGRSWASIGNNLVGPGGTFWNTGNIPDCRGKVVMGAATTGTGVGPTQPPDIGQTGGSNTKNLQHTHTTTHAHTVNAHTHIVDSHQHGGATDAQGSHAHTFAGGHTIYTRENAFFAPITVRDVNTFARSNTLESLYAAGVGYGSPTVGGPVGMDAAGVHAHNIATDFRSPGTSPASPGTNSVAAVSDNGTFTTAEDIRNAYVGFLLIMRVR
jgi:microcystin-dependent protein